MVLNVKNCIWKKTKQKRFKGYKLRKRRRKMKRHRHKSSHVMYVTEAFSVEKRRLSQGFECQNHSSMKVQSLPAQV